MAMSTLAHCFAPCQGDDSDPSLLVVSPKQIADDSTTDGSVGSSTLEAIPESSKENDYSGEEEQKHNANVTKQQLLQHNLSVSTASRNGDHNEDASSPGMKLVAQINVDDGETEKIRFADRDFDVNPTKLYMYLQKKQWHKAIVRIEEAPHEAQIWTYRKEDDGLGVRWRLTPLHGAIIFQSPTEVVEALLAIYPEATEFKDDQGSLPIHLAHKRGSSCTIVRLLLDTFPDCVDVRDRKGRTPKTMAVASNGPRQREFFYAYKTHMTSRKKAREAARIEAQQEFNNKLGEIKSSHRSDIETLERKSELEVKSLEKTVEEMESDLIKTHDHSRELKQCIMELEKEIKNLTESETELMGRICTLDRELKRSEEVNATFRLAMETEKAQLASEIVDAQQSVEKLKAEKDILNKSLEAVVEAAEVDKKKLETTIEEQEQTMKTLQEECEKAREHSSLLERQLQQRGSNELALASQISNLGSQLAKEASESSKASNDYSHRIKDLEMERDQMRKEVINMAHKLHKVATFLEDMTKEQEAIIEQAAAHEVEMEAAALEHARILAEVQKQQLLDVQAQENRMKISNLLKVHDDEFFLNREAREKIVSDVAAHSKMLEEGAQNRSRLVTHVKNIKEQMHETMDDVRNALPNIEEEETPTTPQSNDDPNISNPQTEFQTMDAADVGEDKEPVPRLEGSFEEEKKEEEDVI